jgi:hypothetical protein
MTYLVVNVPKEDGISIDYLFPEDLLNKIPSGEEVELIEEPKWYVLRTNFGKLPEKKDLRVTLAKIDIHLSGKNLDYQLWIGIERLNVNGLFYKASKGEDVNRDIERELEKVYNIYGRL